MKHINYERQVALRNRLTLGQLFPTESISGNFAVLCGEHGQRREVALQAIGQYVGKVGVVLLHNDPILSSDLQRLVGSRTDTRFRDANSDPSARRKYDPLYGLSRERVLDALVPLAADSVRYQELAVLRSHLQEYLSIMEYRYSVQPDSFGSYPYNLDLLLQLAHMPYPDLKEEVLDYLPDSMRRSLEARLSGGSVQEHVWAVLRNFAVMAKKHLWTPANFASHSRMSIVNSVSNREVISVRVPDSDPALLDYLDLELEELNQNGVPYLLVESGLHLPNSHRMTARFLGEHSHLNYRTGIISQSPASVLSADSHDDLNSLVSEYHEIVLLACAGRTEAEMFSSVMGNYYRFVTSEVKNSSRRMFAILPTRTRGVERREVEERNIRPEELMALGDGALLMGAHHERPLLIKHLVR